MSAVDDDELLFVNVSAHCRWLGWQSEMKREAIYQARQQLLSKIGGITESQPHQVQKNIVSGSWLIFFNFLKKDKLSKSKHVHMWSNSWSGWGVRNPTRHETTFLPPPQWSLRGIKGCVCYQNLALKYWIDNRLATGGCYVFLGKKKGGGEKEQCLKIKAEGSSPEHVLH